MWVAERQMFCKGMPGLFVDKFFCVIVNFTGDHGIVDDSKCQSSGAVVENQTAGVQFIMHILGRANLHDGAIEGNSHQGSDIGSRGSGAKLLFAF